MSVLCSCSCLDNLVGARRGAALSARDFMNGDLDDVCFILILLLTM